MKQQRKNTAAQHTGRTELDTIIDKKNEDQAKKKRAEQEAVARKDEAHKSGRGNRGGNLGG